MKAILFEFKFAQLQVSHKQRTKYKYLFKNSDVIEEGVRGTNLKWL